MKNGAYTSGIDGWSSAGRNSRGYKPSGAVHDTDAKPGIFYYLFSVKILMISLKTPLQCRVSIGEKQLRPGWTLLLKNKFSKQDRPKRYIISPARSSILTLYHVLASELLRSSSLVGKGRERNEVLKKISKIFGGPLEKFDFRWSLFQNRSKPCMLSKLVSSARTTVTFKVESRIALIL